jgi:uncharacterized protein
LSARVAGPPQIPPATPCVHDGTLRFGSATFLGFSDLLSMSCTPRFVSRRAIIFLLTGALSAAQALGESAGLPAASQPRQLVPLKSVRLLESPFRAGIEVNRSYLLAHDVDRLIAPFRREAGLEPRKPQYGDWENGLDGHTAGHYLSALAGMIAAGADTPDGEMKRRLDYMVSELAVCQQQSPEGYIGGVPGSRAVWADVAAGKIDAQGFSLNGKWVPWYNLHKTFAGLRDAYLIGGNQQAKDVLTRYGDWVQHLTSRLSDEQVQTMLRSEHGGMNEVLADIYAITGDAKYLELARRFVHRAVLDPLMQGEDRLTGLHANTQIPKVVGLQRIAALTGDAKAHAGAEFFWRTVTSRRSVAFGGNSVSEHFNDPKNFRGLLEHREGPETCNTYNMLRLTEQLFDAQPDPAYVDYYERALFNHILSSIHPSEPGFVYFTPIRPGHYRVYSKPEHHFWCCVGSGMENPGRYGQFLYARAKDGVYVNLFVASELNVPDLGVSLRQETQFPHEERSTLRIRVQKPTQFTLYLRHPRWVAADGFRVRVNGELLPQRSSPSSFVPVSREWRDGDRVEVTLPMQTTVEGLPDGSPWYAIFRGPILLASRTSTEGLAGLRAEDKRGSHIARGRLQPLDTVTVLLTTPEALPAHVVPDPTSGPMRFRLKQVAHPPAAEGILLEPFYGLHDARYQMYWECTTAEGLAEKQKRRAAEERAREAREAATLDFVAVGEQQPEVDHGFKGEGVETGEFQDRRWRHGRWFQYTLNPQGQNEVDLAVTYSGWDRDRRFEIYANDVLLATEHLDGSRTGEFFERTYAIPAEALAKSTDQRVTIKFVGQGKSLAGGVYDVRLLRRAADSAPTQR